PSLYRSSSCRFHMAESPPFVEICKRPACPVADLTYTSERPDSSDKYAIHLLSGENAIPVSSPSVLTTDCSFPSATDRIDTSVPVSAWVSSTSNLVPSADQ